MPLWKQIYLDFGSQRDLPRPLPLSGGPDSGFTALLLSQKTSAEADQAQLQSLTCRPHPLCRSFLFASSAFLTARQLVST